nr:peptidoglycan recognition family protein [Delftia acidovorans]
MTVIENGLLVDRNVEVKIFPSIQHGDLLKVNSIVLHRTNSPTAASVLNSYKAGQKTGAHFLVGKDGKIHQTANLKRVCWHVGILQVRCLNESNCETADFENINALLHQKGMGFGARVRKVSEHEKQKPYPLRYPVNAESLGIEVVGMFQRHTQDYEVPTQAQLYQTQWLVRLLVGIYGLRILSDVYAHGAIARKQPAEGSQLLRYIFSGA